MLTGLKLNRNRWLTHLALLIVSILACGITFFYLPTGTLNEILTLGLGYVALLFLAVTLLIGPLNLVRKRRNPVNIDLRRDVGIWSGITALLHVVFSFQLYQNGDILGYFFTSTPTGYSLPKPDLFNMSNYTGLIATFVMVVLLFTSNQLSLRWLKGKRWKLIQRFNYLLVIMTLVHTFGYQAFNVRESYFVWGVIGLSLVVLVAQLGGVVVWMNRTKQREEALAASAGLVPVGTANLQPVTTANLSQPALARRRFLMLSGGAILGGFAIGIGFDRVLSGSHAEDTSLAEAPSASTTVGVSATAAAAPPTTGITTGRQPATTGTSAVGQSGGATTAKPTTAASTSSSPTPTASTASGATSTTAAAGARSIVLAKAGSLAVGSALKFTTPDTGESAFLIKETDGSVKAFSGVCTHRPYPLVFDSSSHMLVCDLHSVPFNIVTGAPTRNPARTALKGFKVATDSQGNIVYNQA